MSERLERLSTIMPTGLVGSVAQIEGVAAAVAGLPAPVGAIVEICDQSGRRIDAEVIGFRDGLTRVYPLQEMTGVRQGNRVILKRSVRRVPVSEAMLGRVVDAHGQPVDNLPEIPAAELAPLVRQPPKAVDRPRIDAPLSTGIRAIDAMLTCGLGQRLGVFAGSGVGKSVLLGMMAQYASADVIVIGLIGERGREVNEFIERDLGKRGLARSVVVVATSDQPALCRVQAAMTATAIAESFRDRGKNVLLIMDSLTRFAMAQREIGLAAGEPPTTKGYPPSVFAMLPKLVERTGRSPLGSITAFYSVLVEGDDTNEPISDAVRGLLDGHVVLTRALASRGHFPAIDLLQSISRLMTEVTTPDHQQSAQHLRRLLAAYQENEDLINIGAYRNGANSVVDASIALRDEINAFLVQGFNEASHLPQTQADLKALADRAKLMMASAPQGPATQTAQPTAAQPPADANDNIPSPTTS